MRICKVDKNQKSLVADLKKIGCSVQHLHTVGDGCPDIVVGYRGINYLFEIKNPDLKGKLTPKEKEFFDTWRGQVAQVETLDDCRNIFNFILK